MSVKKQKELINTVYVITEVDPFTGLREVIGVTDGFNDFERLRELQEHRKDIMIGVQEFSTNDFISREDQEDLDDFIERIDNE